MLHFELHVRSVSSLENHPTDKIAMIVGVMEDINIPNYKLTMIEEINMFPCSDASPYLRIYYSDDNMMHAIKTLQKRNFGLQVQIVQMHQYSPEQMSEAHL